MFVNEIKVLDDNSGAQLGSTDLSDILLSNYFIENKNNIYCLMIVPVQFAHILKSLRILGCGSS